MHYHIFSGPRSSKIPDTSLRFKDRMEGIAVFIDMAKVLWANQETPPPYEQIKKTDKMSLIRVQDERHRLVFVYCDYDNCDDDDHLELKLRL